MKTPRLLACIVAATLLGAGSLAAQTRSSSPGRKSPHETVSTVIGDRAHGTRITITYGRPHTNDPRTGEPRKIWGGLVPWGKADRLGADEATVLITQRALRFGATEIPAGAYTLYQIPAENGTDQLVFSSALGGWGIPVNEKHDVAKVQMTRTELAEPVDQLTLGIQGEASGKGGTLFIRWEKTEFSAPFIVVK